ncbi:MAG TPA: hypothetical protein V6D10_19735 [Trichocoleus sp.]
MQEQPTPHQPANLNIDLETLVKAIVNAVVAAYQSERLEDALLIREQLHRLPDYLVTEILNATMLQLVQLDPNLCRWFILDIFLKDADPEGKADVAERINLLLADLQANQQ